MTISLFIRKAIRKIKRDIKNTFCKKTILKEEINDLQYQLRYLTNHISPEKIKPATGYLREFQIKEIEFMKEIIPILNKENIFPILSGGCVLGYLRHNGFVPWDDDLDFDLMRNDFNKLIDYAKTHWLWIEIIQQDDLINRYYDDAIRANPNTIIAIRTPYCLHVFRGTSIKDCVNLEFFMFDYVKDNVNEEIMIQYKHKIHDYIHSRFNRKKIQSLLNFYENELKNSPVFTETPTKRIYYGLGNNGFTEYGYHGILNYDDIFPPKDAIFEGANVKIPNNPENAMKCLYGDWKKLPSDIGISHGIEVINEYLRDYNFEEINYKNS